MRLGLGPVTGFVESLGRRAACALIRKSGNLAIGGVLSSARETPEGAPMSPSRLWRLAEARRPLFILLLGSTIAAGAAEAPAGSSKGESTPPAPVAATPTPDQGTSTEAAAPAPEAKAAKKTPKAKKEEVLATECAPKRQEDPTQSSLNHVS